MKLIVVVIVLVLIAVWLAGEWVTEPLNKWIKK